MALAENQLSETKTNNQSGIANSLISQGIAAKAKFPTGLLSRIPAQKPVVDARSLGMSVYQHVSMALSSAPNGLHQATFLVALGAIAGYGAKVAVKEMIRNGEVDDDFSTLTYGNDRTAEMSQQVNDLVTGMNHESIASVLLAKVMQSGCNWMPNADQLLHQFSVDAAGADCPNYDFVPEKHRPHSIPEGLLRMFYEDVSRIFRGHAGSPEILAIAPAIAIVEALGVHQRQIGVADGAEIALRTAIAMSKTTRGF